MWHGFIVRGQARMSQSFYERYILEAPHTHHNLSIRQGTRIASSLSSHSTSRCYFWVEGDIRCETSVVHGHTRQDWLPGLSLDLVRNDILKLNKVVTDKSSKRDTGQRVLRIFWARL